MNANLTTMTREEQIAHYTRLASERAASGACMGCWGEGTTVVAHYSHRSGVSTDRVVTCPDCKGTGRAEVAK